MLESLLLQPFAPLVNTKIVIMYDKLVCAPRQFFVHDIQCNLKIVKFNLLRIYKMYLENFNAFTQPSISLS